MMISLSILWRIIFEDDDLAISLGLVDDRYDYGNLGALTLNISFQY